jgi:cytochrome c peroxidase
MWRNYSMRGLPATLAAPCTKTGTRRRTVPLKAFNLFVAMVGLSALAAGADAGAIADATGARPDASAVAGAAGAAGARADAVAAANAVDVRADAADSANRPFYSSPFETTPAVAAMTALGRMLFFDTGLSVSGTMACATCHSPIHAFGPPNDLAVQRGAVARRSGLRAVPSLMYTQNVPPFTEHYFDGEGDDSIDQGPMGGRTWDGRAQSAHDQARLPLLSPFEMGNASTEAVVARVERAPYAAQFRDTFGERVFKDRELAFKGVLMALETYQQSPAEFYPYSSKYDAWLRRQATLTAAESRGLDAFDDPAKGNCARCHPSAMRQGAFPQFTDFGYAAIGVPRNAAIPANAQRRYFDLGLCGPLRTDMDKQEYCGLFRTPSLRNVATRRVFFHNGVLHRLEDVVRFYAERDTAPQKWYRHAAGGSTQTFDDLPAKYRGNLDRESPFDRHVGEKPPLNEGDIQDIVAFLNSLTDGYRAGSK